MVQQITATVLAVENCASYTDRLQAAMRRAGIDPSSPQAAHELAGALDISYQAAKKAIEGTTKMLTAENNVYAARLLGVDSEWLATGEGEPRPKSRFSDRALEVAAIFDKRIPPELHEPAFAQFLNVLMLVEQVGRTVDPASPPTERPRLDQKTPPEERR